mmetsp:Transcript_5088/g.7064  ORF Transcript_5088/g.7064 Transcript_5088/m.7064 type:complete len:556 (-) Transcript_5088:73-1740(-)|eukprot:CAMPEP_0184750074 /NCGR_PEP_ID=MMETSP0315-20130426/33269_1 /TAXON_ID=101924 /ORGANISM="Rhodosorus marinus, Strain UTEX LB 2760" /LENGTH=555 /DNA_ID=CAMNT_0027227811 /DNA_START=116 /DNA_END=1783 /DNA_ORIENTATION=-
MEAFVGLADLLTKPNRTRACSLLTMSVSGSRSTARSKPNARVRTTSSTRKSASGRGSKSASSAEMQDDKLERDMLSSAHVNDVLEECSRLILFDDVLEDEVVQNLLNLLEAVYQLDKEEDESLRGPVSESYRDYFSSLAAPGLSWTDRFLSLLLHSDNVFSLACQKKNPVDMPEALLSAAKHDLDILQKLFRFDPKRIAELVSFYLGVPVPAWQMQDHERSEFLMTVDGNQRTLRLQFEDTLSSWADLVPELRSNYMVRGSGFFADHKFFLLGLEDAEFIPVETPDEVILDDIFGNRRQKKALRQNFEFLLQGLAAHHVLLAGSRGSGKSSLVKACVNTYADRGLRLVEIESAIDMETFRSIFAELSGRAQKFVIFVDDFNYDVDEEEYRCLRKVLDGSCVKIPQNVIICVTSCRYADLQKNIIAGDAEGEELYLEEDVLGFSDRFGTILIFEEATKEKYLNTVKYLVSRVGIGEIGADILELRAFQFAKAKGGYCGRIAKQFVNFLSSEQSFLKSEMNDCRSNIGRINEARSNAEEPEPSPDVQPRTGNDGKKQ